MRLGGSRIYISIDAWNDEIATHIRKYWYHHQQEKWLPSKDGIRLSGDLMDQLYTEGVKEWWEDTRDRVAANNPDAD